MKVMPLKQIKSYHCQKRIPPVGFEYYCDWDDDHRQEWKEDAGCFDYLNSEPARTRYTPSISWLERQFSRDRIVSVLDFGCGDASYANLIPCNWVYTGVEHHKKAIAKCRKKFPQFKFIHSDINFFERYNKSAQIQPIEKFDIVVLSGFLFNSVDKDGNKIDDLEVVFSLLNICKKNGHLVIITPFVFSYSKDFNYEKQSEWKFISMDRILNRVPHREVFRHKCEQIGLTEVVANQKYKPNWWTTNQRNFTHCKGNCMGCCTIIIQKFDVTSYS
jgi:SAM-dependent methyltransferase